MNVDVFRFAFSCIWELTKKAKIVSTKFHKSIIKSQVYFQENKLYFVIKSIKSQHITLF